MTYPEWNSAVEGADGRLSLTLIRRVKDAIFNQEPKPEFYIFPPVVRGNSQRDRARRTVVLRGGVRVVLPEGSSPHVYLFTDGKAFR